MNKTRQLQKDLKKKTSKTFQDPFKRLMLTIPPTHLIEIPFKYCSEDTLMLTQLLALTSLTKQTN